MEPRIRGYVRKRRLYAAGFQDDDLVQEGLIGVMDAVKKFDPNIGTPFTAYCYIHWRNKLYTAITYSHACFRDAEVMETTAPAPDMLANPARVYEGKETHDEFWSG